MEEGFKGVMLSTCPNNSNINSELSVDGLSLQSLNQAEVKSQPYNSASMFEQGQNKLKSDESITLKIKMHNKRYKIQNCKREDFANYNFIINLIKKNNVNKIQKVVADYFKISIDDLKNKLKNIVLLFLLNVIKYIILYIL